MSDADAAAYAPTIANLIEQASLRWVFVGGKGGVGKTTCSCSIAVQLAAARESVLLISTDPAHNLSDAFNQKFGPEPILVNGFTNLYALEVEPKLDLGSGLSESSEIGSVAVDMLSAMPGMDELFTFSHLMKMADSRQFSCVVFDTAPTGHTLRLLALPSTIDRAMGRFLGMQSQLGSLVSQATKAIGAGDMGDPFEKVASLKVQAERISKMFKDHTTTTFVCVCIPEFLSLYETERLVQELANGDIDTRNIIVNQVVMPPNDSHCQVCESRVKMQSKYIGQIEELYEDFHVIQLPLLTEEVRGSARIRAFSRLLSDEKLRASVNSSMDVMRV